METKPFNIKLTAAERDKLEQHRIALGLRSHADVIRHWIGAEGDVARQQREMTAQLSPVRAVAPEQTGIQRMTLADVRPPFEPRLKKPKGSKP